MLGPGPHRGRDHSVYGRPKLLQTYSIRAFNILFANNNTFTNNVAEADKSWGFGVGFSNGNRFIGNTVIRNAEEGFLLVDIHGNQVSGNTSKQNLTGFRLAQGSSDNTLSNNTANLNTQDGFTLQSTCSACDQPSAAHDNQLTGNTANSNGHVGYDVTEGASNNLIRKNTGHNNTVFDALDDGTGTGNQWIANVFGTTSGI